MLEKLNWFCLPNDTGAIDVKMDVFGLEEKSFFDAGVDFLF